MTTSVNGVTSGSVQQASSSVSRMARNSLWNMSGWIVASAIRFLTAPILIRLLGQNQYGLMALLNTVLTPLNLLDLGMGEATIKYVAESLGQGDYQQAGKYVRNTLIFNLGVGALGCLILIALAGTLAISVFNLSPESQIVARQCLYWVGITWFCTQVRQTFIGVVMARQRFELLNLGAILTQLVTIVAGLGVLAAGGNLLDYMRIQGIVSGVAGVVWLILAQRLLPGISFFPSLDRAIFRKSFGFGFWQMLNNVGGILAHQSQQWILGVLLPVVTVGFYNIGFQLTGLVYSLAFKVGQVLFPTVSQMQGQARDRDAAQLTVQVNWALSILALCGFVPLGVFANDILRLWVGASIAMQATNVLRILTLGVANACLFAVPNFYLLGTGRSRWLAVMSFVQGLITVVTSALLIPRLGLDGAGWGLTAGTIVHLAVLVIMWQRIFHRWVSAAVYFSATFPQLAVSVALAAGFMRIRSAVTWTPGWIQLGIVSLICALSCGVTFVLIDSFLPGGVERRTLLWRLTLSIVPGLGNTTNRWRSSRC